MLKDNTNLNQEDPDQLGTAVSMRILLRIASDTVCRRVVCNLFLALLAYVKTMAQTSKQRDKTSALPTESAPQKESALCRVQSELDNGGGLYQPLPL